jgi:hypothetical protein
LTQGVGGLSRGGARAVVHIWPAVAQDPLALRRRVVVAPDVLPARFVRVRGPSVELETQAELRIVDIVILVMPASGAPDLAPAGRQSVGALDITQMASFEHGVAAGGHIVNRRLDLATPSDPRPLVECR